MPRAIALLFSTGVVFTQAFSGMASAWPGQADMQQGNPASPGSESRAGKTYALLIGISRYKADPLVPSLRFAHQDAAVFAALLKTPLGGRLQEPDEIKLITNEQATRAGIDDAVRSFVDTRGGPDDTLILFIAAHGVDLRTEQDPLTRRPLEREPYILTYESNPDDPKTTGYPMSEFRSLVAREATHFGRVFVYIDVCHAANIAGIAGGSELQPEVKQVFDGLKGELGLMLASHARAYAYESESFGGGHGAFSYFLLAGLNGAAALPGLTSITFEDLSLYVENQVYLFTGRAQKPTSYPTNPGLVVVEDTKKAGLSLPPAKPMKETDKRAARRGANLSATLPLAESAETGVNASDGEFALALERGLLLREQEGSAARILDGLRSDPARRAQLSGMERRLRVALENRGQDIIIEYQKGDQTAQTKQDFEQCARYFEQALQVGPDSPFNRSRALFCRGRALIFDGSIAEAERNLRESIRLDPRRAYAYNALGIAELEQVVRTGNPRGLDTASAHFLNAMRFAPYWVYPIHNLALVASERGDWDEAIRLYKSAMNIAPWYSYLPYNLGLLYERLGDLDQAERWFERALEVTQQYRRNGAGAWTDRARAWAALGTVARERNQLSRATSYFQKALADDPAEKSARHNLALLLARRHEYAKADALWLQNLASTPPFLPSRIAYASSLASRSELALATDQLRQIVAENAGYVGARENLARLLMAQNQLEAARAQVDEALKSGEPAAVLLELRGDILSRLGRTAEARTDWLQGINSASDRTARNRLKRKLREIQE